MIDQSRDIPRAALSPRRKSMDQTPSGLSREAPSPLKPPGNGSTPLSRAVPDTLSIEQRSERMSRVRASGNKSTELRLIVLLKQSKITGWRRRMPLPGKPDFAFPTERVAVFVDGCFWHGCKKHYRRPKSRQDFWDAKVMANTRRDAAVKRELEKLGWRVIRLWEHDLDDRTWKRAAARLIRTLSRPRPSHLLPAR